MKIKFNVKTREGLNLAIVKTIYNPKTDSFDYDANLNVINVSNVENFSDLFSKKVKFYVSTKANGSKKISLEKPMDKDDVIKVESKVMDLSLFNGCFDEWKFNNAKNLSGFLAFNQCFNTHPLEITAPKCGTIQCFLYFNAAFNQPLTINGNRISFAQNCFEGSVFDNWLELNLRSLEDTTAMFKNSNFTQKLKLTLPNLVCANEMFSFTKQFKAPIELDAPRLKLAPRMFYESKYNHPIEFNSKELRNIEGIFIKSKIASRVTFTGVKLANCLLNEGLSFMNSALYLKTEDLKENDFQGIEQSDVFLHLIGTKVSFWDLNFNNCQYYTLDYFEKEEMSVFNQISMLKSFGLIRDVDKDKSSPFPLVLKVRDVLLRLENHYRETEEDEKLNDFALFLDNTFNQLSELLSNDVLRYVALRRQNESIPLFEVLEQMGLMGNNGIDLYLEKNIVDLMKERFDNSLLKREIVNHANKLTKDQLENYKDTFVNLGYVEKIKDSNNNNNVKLRI